MHSEIGDCRPSGAPLLSSVPALFFIRIADYRQLGSFVSSIFLFAPPLPSAKAGKASVSVSRSAAVPAALNEFLENAAGRVGL
jgi:hypothetical protein